MATTTTLLGLSSNKAGVARLFESPAGSVEAANRMLQYNHDKYHVFWRDVGGHNHMAHAVLTIFALGGDEAELQRAYDDGVEVQRDMPPLDMEVVKRLSDPEQFEGKLSSIPDYTNFLAFFEQEISSRGWQAVCSEYCFSRTPLGDKMLARMYEGAYHPLIHLGLGIEFEQPAIIAEALAQAAIHDSAGLDRFFLHSDEHARAASPAATNKSMLQLIHEVRNTEKIRTAAKVQDGPVRVRDGVLGRAGSEMATLAAQFRVSPQHEAVERATASMISCNAFLSAAAQRPGKARKIDFFHMHNVTSSIFLTVLIRQPWIKLEDKARLVEWKARLDLVWYAASSAAALDMAAVVDYKPTYSDGMDWLALYKATNKVNDDGHVAKFIRAIKNGADVSRPFENDSENFPIQGDLWFKVAQMCYDSTLYLPVEEKWIWGCGYDPLWFKVPSI